jgi:hypothetical protein
VAGRVQKANETDSLEEYVVTGAETVVSCTSSCKRCRAGGEDETDEEETVIEVRLEVEAAAVVGGDLFVEFVSLLVRSASLR